MRLSPTAKSGLLAAALVGGAFLLLALVFAAFLAADRASGQPVARPDPGSARGIAAGERGQGPAPAAAEWPAKEEPAPPVRLSRDEFKKLVLYKVVADVIAGVGWPDETRDSGGLYSYWTYRDRTYDPASGRADALAVVEIQSGHVAVAVRFR